MRDGRAGLGHPPWQGGGGGRVFFLGSERPEAGQPRRIIVQVLGKSDSWVLERLNPKPYRRTSWD